LERRSAAGLPTKADRASLLLGALTVAVLLVSTWSFF